MANKNDDKLRQITEEAAGGEETVSKEIWEARRETLREEVEAALPGFVRACEEAHKAKSKILMHQNAFACMFSQQDMLLLGKAVKYAGFYPDATLMIGGEPTYETDEPEQDENNDD